MLHRRLYVIAALAFFLLFVLGVVGVISPAWRAGPFGVSEYVYSGLVMRCHRYAGLTFYRCAPFDMGSQVAWFEASRVLCCVTLTLLLALTFGSGFLHFADKKQEDYWLLFTSSITTALLGVAGASVYAMRSTEIHHHQETELAWGWGLFLAAMLTLGIVSGLLLAWARFLQRRPKVKQVVPLRG